MKVEKTPLWIKGLKVDVHQDMIFLWSNMKTNINSLEGKLLFKFKKLFKSQNNVEVNVTDMFVSKAYGYLIASASNGLIAVFKLAKNKQLMHVFDGHRKAVTSLIEVQSDPRHFLSASEDGTIRMHSLHQYNELYSFILPAGTSNIQLLDDKMFSSSQKNQINIGKLHRLAISFYTSNVKVKEIKKLYRTV